MKKGCSAGNKATVVNFGGYFISFGQSSGQISIIPEHEFKGFGEDSLTQTSFGVTSPDVAIICPEQ